MRMIATIRVESDDGKVAEQSVSSVGVDTRVKGIDPDAAKEDFIAQARGLLTSIGETHVPALYATVQQQVDASGQQEPESPAESQAMAQIKGRLQQLRDRKAVGKTAEQPDYPAELQTATDELKEKA